MGDLIARPLQVLELKLGVGLTGAWRDSTVLAINFNIALAVPLISMALVVQSQKKYRIAGNRFAEVLSTKISRSNFHGLTFQNVRTSF